MHKPPPGCGPDCEEEHFSDGACLVCGRGIRDALYCLQCNSVAMVTMSAGYGPHNGHNCIGNREGNRGSWIIGGDDTPGSGGGSDGGEEGRYD